MYIEDICKHIDFKLHNLAKSRIANQVCYSSVISPFSRIYFITEGEGVLQLSDSKIILEKGFMYLIPSFEFCSYTFNANLQQYYVHLSYRLTNGLNIYDVFNIQHKVTYSTLDLNLVNKLTELHPNLALPTSEPEIYQSKPWLGPKPQYKSASEYFETNGILAQFLSRFLLNEKHTYKKALNKRIALQPVFQRIQQKLCTEINISELATMICLSNDHFARVFKTATGYPPGEYILRKRIEQAQYLLLTTSLSHVEICERVGFSSASYFSRIFKKYTGFPPGRYRNTGYK